jgi:hypothetical protein
MTQVSITQLSYLIRTLSYVVSTHAADGLEDDNLNNPRPRKHHPHRANR